MNTTSTARLFRFGGILHQTYQDIAPQLSALEDHLNALASTAEFTALLEQVYFIPIIVPDGQRMEHEERLSYNADAKKLLIQKQLAPDSDLQLALLEGVKEVAATDKRLASLVGWLEEVGG